MPRLSLFALFARISLPRRSTLSVGSNSTKPRKAETMLAAKIEIAEQLLAIIEKRIEELKTTQAEALKAVIQRKIEQLEKEAAAEQDKAALNAINEPLAKLFHYRLSTPTLNELMGKLLPKSSSPI